MIARVPGKGAGQFRVRDKIQGVAQEGEAEGEEFVIRREDDQDERGRVMAGRVCGC